MNDEFGDRMKEYEAQETSRKFLPTLPLICRVDGRNFSKFTKGMNRPYDQRMIDAMVGTAKHLMTETHALFAFTQSDELSLIWEQPSYHSEMFFNGKVMKMTSVLASLATAAFTRQVSISTDEAFRIYAERLPHFDARVFSLPNRTEAANAILWRAQDATKNAISMAAHHYFSHKSLHGINGAQMQERLFQEKAINFRHYPDAFRQGSFLRREVITRTFTTEELQKIPVKNRPDHSTMVTRSEIRVINMPIFSKVMNRVEVIFDGEMPKTTEDVANV